MFNQNAPSVADIAAIGGSSSEWWPIIILFALFGGFGRGGFGNNGNCGCDSACATVGDVERGFNQQSTNQRFNAIDNAFAQLGYANQQNAYETRLAITNAQAVQQQCCCETQRAIDNVRYDMSQGFCGLGTTISVAARDIIDNANANYRALHDEIVAFRMEDKDTQIRELQSQVQALNLSKSQDNQNRYLIDTLRPCPVPAYQTCNPWGANGYGGCCSCPCN